VGFGRACAPVRCAHPSFSARCHANQAAVHPAPAHRSFAASQKYIKSIELGPPTSKAFFFPQDHRGYVIWGPLPQPRPSHFADSSGNILGSKLCTGATIRPNFWWFFLFYIVFGSFFLYLSSFSSLLFNFFLFISSYSSSSYSSLIFNCLLSFWGVFLRGQAFFDPFGVKINVYTPDATILFFSSYLFLLFSSYSFRSIFFLFLFLSSIFKQFVVLNVSILNTHWEKVHN
jgi:hypothetical protein